MSVRKTRAKNEIKKMYHNEFCTALDLYLKGRITLTTFAEVFGLTRSTMKTRLDDMWHNDMIMPKKYFYVDEDGKYIVRDAD